MSHARAILEDLESFLLSGDVFWPRPGTSSRQGPYDLSLGQVLLEIDLLRAQSQAAPAGAAGQLEAAAEAIEALLGRWAAATERKAVAELPQRLTLWQAYLEEVHEGATGAGGYPQAVRNRVIAERLGPLIRSADLAERRRQQALDRQLRAVFEPGGFVWESGLATAYPLPQFWFLYGAVRPASR